ncbi:ABC transporter permease subunit [Paraburkholderia azotifigens]|uniref:ABC transporter permease subunit n=1 Tax=Paraburkholderia azotifigens TaxID=2057004 RepID=A0ABU9R8M5_9BURK
MEMPEIQKTPFAHMPPPPVKPSAARRAARLRSLVVQSTVLLCILAVIGAFFGLVWAGLKSHGINFSLDFLEQPAGFDISEGLTVAHGPEGLTLAPFNGQMTNAQALLAGLYNTLVTAAFSIVFSTIAGVLLGVTRMSKNWIARNWAWGFIELIRNTPLLIQILFWYFAVFLNLPAIADAAHFGGSFIASRQGVFTPWLLTTSSSDGFGWFVLGAIALVVATITLRSRPRRIGCGLGALAVIAIGIAVTGTKFHIDMPVPSAFSVSGGAGFSPEMASLIVALSVNTAAYIAEIVRGAVQSVDKGQWEASAALGMGERESLWVIVLPQAVKVILPSLGNQYVSLAKSTSFAIAIGFPDLFNVYGTVGNQTGRSLEGILIVMTVYLFISLTIGALANAYNRRVMKKGAR